MISKVTDQSIEQRIFFEGEKRRLDSYLSNMIFSFVDNTKLSLEIFADNKFFTEKLKGELKRQQKSILIENKKISISFIDKLLERSDIILHIDNNLLGDYSHSSHFIVVERKVADKYNIIDPLTGTRKNLSASKLEEAISSLKSSVKMCPIIIRKV